MRSSPDRAPYHAFALRQDADVWSVAAKRVQVVEVPEHVEGDEVELVVTDETSARWSSTTAASSASIPSLEAFAAEQFGSFVAPREPPRRHALGGHGHSRSEPIP